MTPLVDNRRLEIVRHYLTAQRCWISQYGLSVDSLWVASSVHPDEDRYPIRTGGVWDSSADKGAILFVFGYSTHENKMN
jgi:hypothetical protein